MERERSTWWVVVVEEAQSRKDIVEWFGAEHAE